ncbi:MAG: hypothetical protein WCX65_19225 [bacterium]
MDRNMRGKAKVKQNNIDSNDNKNSVSEDYNELINQIDSHIEKNNAQIDRNSRNLNAQYSPQGQDDEMN